MHDNHPTFFFQDQKMDTYVMSRPGDGPHMEFCDYVAFNTEEVIHRGNVGVKPYGDEGVQRLSLELRVMVSEFENENSENLAEILKRHQPKTFDKRVSENLFEQEFLESCPWIVFEYVLNTLPNARQLELNKSEAVAILKSTDVLEIGGGDPDNGYRKVNILPKFRLAYKRILEIVSGAIPVIWARHLTIEEKQATRQQAGLPTIDEKQANRRLVSDPKPTSAFSTTTVVLASGLLAVGLLLGFYVLNRDLKREEVESPEEMV